MAKKILGALGIMILAVILYFLLWPVPISPVSWQAPFDPGYTKAFAPNNRLAGIEFLQIAGEHGPECMAFDEMGRIYAATGNGWVVRLDSDGKNPEKWVNTGGRPLGIAFDKSGNLIVADAFFGLLSISSDKKITVLATKADNVPIAFADDVAIAADGKIYFSDASTKFNAKEIGDTMEASMLDLMEHGGHGRLLLYDPALGRATTIANGLNFANGVAVSHDQTYVLVNETGSYRIMRYWISGPKKGEIEPLLENLPSFPDNISTGLNGRYWVALVSPRNCLLDSLSDKPFVRKMVCRMPKFLRPKAVYYGHIIAIDGAGNILEDLQDPDGAYPINTSVVETDKYLYIGSLETTALGRLPKANVGL